MRADPAWNSNFGNLGFVDYAAAAGSNCATGLRLGLDGHRLDHIWLIVDLVLGALLQLF